MSYLSVFAQNVATAEVVARVPAAAFEPAPAVDSAVLVLRRRDRPVMEVGPARDPFYRVVQAGFRQRRKQVHNGLTRELPVDREGLTRTMERYYPSVLASSRVAGRVVVELIVDENGRVRPNSARVLETTHPAFAEATLQAVERFRFQPAKMMGVPVPVFVTIPINWTVPE